MLKSLLTLVLLFWTGVSYSIDELSFEYLTVKDGLAQNNAQSIEKDKYGFLWIGTWNGLCKYDGYRFYVYRANPDDATSLSNNRIGLIYKDNKGILWISSFDSIICRYNYETDNFTRFNKSQLPDSLIKFTRRRNNFSYRYVRYANTVWEIKKNVLWQTNLLTNQKFNYESSILNVNSLSDDYVVCLFKDENDILWIGTQKGGVNKVDLKGFQISSHMNVVTIGETFINTSIKAIWIEKDRIWLGTSKNGITTLNRGYSPLKNYTDIGNGPNNIFNGSVRSFCKDYKGDLWIGYTRGLDKFQAKHKSFVHYTKNGGNGKVDYAAVFTIHEDKQKKIWIGTYNGIYKYNRDHDNFTFYDLSTYFKGSNAMCIISDSKNNLWIGSERGGLICINIYKESTQLGAITKFNLNLGEKNFKQEERIYSLIEDEYGNIWAGTADGLFSINISTGKIKRYSTQNGLADQYISKLLSDFNGNIWISHKKGISSIIIKTGEIKNFSVKESAKGYEFLDGSGFRDSITGELFFGGNEGYISFNPGQLKNNPFTPKVVFTELQILNQKVAINQEINGRIILKQPLYQTKVIELSHLDKSFSIEFAALHFSNPKNNLYAYKLEGFDKDWIYTDAGKRFAIYSNLYPGRYFLKVKAANCDGLWNTVPNTLEIKILPPWWKTWWAYAVYFLVGWTLFGLFFKFHNARKDYAHQIQVERLHAEKVREIEQAKLHFFTNLSHEFRTPITLIIDPLERLLSENLSKEKANNYFNLMHRNAQLLLKLINQLLDFRKLDSGNIKLEVSSQDIVKYLKNIAGAFELHALQNKIDFNFQTALESYIIDLDRDKLDKILFNLLSNAFKYSQEGDRVTLTVDEFNSPADEYNSTKFVLIQVKDTGIGIPKEAMDKIFNIFYQVDQNKRQNTNSSGIGLALTKELVSLHHGKLSVESEEGKGSCFSVLLPVSQTKENKQNTHDDKIHQEYNPFSITDHQLERDQTIEKTESDDNLQQVLIVEDNNDIRGYLRDYLADKYKIIEANNGTDGFAKAIDIIPDIIISDIMMPGIDGIELCSSLKTDERTSHIPVILLTAHQSDQYKVRGYQTGADAYITKPFSVIVLLARINNLLESRQKLRELFSQTNTLDFKAISVNITDEAFLNKSIDFIKENITNVELDTVYLAQKLNMSQRQLYRKIKAISNQTVHDFITTIRLNLATELLLSGQFNISEVAYQVGYSEPANFTRSFTKKFGETPSAFLHRYKNANA